MNPASQDKTAFKGNKVFSFFNEKISALTNGVGSGKFRTTKIHKVHFDYKSSLKGINKFKDLVIEHFNNCSDIDKASIGLFIPTFPFFLISGQFIEFFESINSIINDYELNITAFAIQVCVLLLSVYVISGFIMFVYKTEEVTLKKLTSKEQVVSNSNPGTKLKAIKTSKIRQYLLNPQKADEVEDHDNDFPVQMRLSTNYPSNSEEFLNQYTDAIALLNELRDSVELDQERFNIESYLKDIQEGEEYEDENEDDSGEVAINGKKIFGEEDEDIPLVDYEEILKM